MGGLIDDGRYHGGCGTMLMRSSNDCRMCGWMWPKAEALHSDDIRAWKQVITLQLLVFRPSHLTLLYWSFHLSL